MTFTDLLYFETIAREESLTRAAQQLYVSQPTLSKFIQRLEADVGLTLFEHIGKRIALTYAGKTYLTYVQRLLSIQREMDAAMLDIQKQDRGVLRVGMPPFRCSFAMPAVLPEFHRLHPNVEFSIMENDSETLDKALRSGEIDLAFYNLSQKQPQLSYELIERERLYVILPENHAVRALAQMDPESGEKSIKLEWLRDEVFIVQNRSQRLGQYILREMENKQIQPKRVMESSNIRAAAYLAASGYGASFITGGLLRHLERVRGFDAYTLMDCDYEMYFAAAWREGCFMPQYARDFIRLIREENLAEPV